MKNEIYCEKKNSMSSHITMSLYGGYVRDMYGEYVGDIGGDMCVLIYLVLIKCSLFHNSFYFE